MTNSNSNSNSIKKLILSLIIIYGIIFALGILLNEVMLFLQVTLICFILYVIVSLVINYIGNIINILLQLYTLVSFIFIPLIGFIYFYDTIGMGIDFRLYIVIGVIVHCCLLCLFFRVSIMEVIYYIMERGRDADDETSRDN